MRAIIQGLTVILLLAILAGVLLVLFTIGSLLNVTSRVPALPNVGGGVQQAQQVVQDTLDPNHPPRGLIYDTEFNALQVFHVGDGLPGGAQYVITVRGIQRRNNADSPETAQYAQMHAELRQPRETRLLGQLVRSDADPHDYAVYTGESFRIGRNLYRVNWVSDVDAAVALATYRHPDALTAPLKFEYE